ncbi:MAG: hypothetical protein KF760_24020 [Candidatus Eremiobacteraeota bacterium]|nr:hypothetical protein [Candidatus Eremiobacteraeota bacterium]MCW5866579.1 hypothetical protein [Candidatus Eremiobacteraeota bacterium]
MVARKYKLLRPARPVELPWKERPSAVIWVESSDYDEDGVLHVEGEDADLVESIRFAVSQAYGSRGRPLSLEEPFSPRDLACALFGRWLKQFEAVEISE